jgi:hypothetical protein
MFARAAHRLHDPVTWAGASQFAKTVTAAVAAWVVAVYGALLVNLRNVLDALDAVVEAQPVRVASPAFL